MCGRYTVRADQAIDIGERFAFDERGGIPRAALGRENVCPTEDVVAVVAGEDGSREARLLRWGLAPSWATLRGMRPLINARDDKLAISGAWKGLASSSAGRCLVVADGWLEWQKPEDPRQPRRPFLHELRGGGLLAFAGLWCTARPKDAEGEVASCAIVTTAASREAAVLHDRMPAVLDGPDAEAAWLDPSVDLDGALDLVTSLPEGRLRISPVSPVVNTAGNDDLQLVMPL
jgi:putative SOS response-associated peptidase YedK